MLTRRTAAAAALMAAAALPRGPARAQAPAWPVRPVTMVVPFATGGSVDATLRVLKAPLEERLGQPVVPDYRPGAATALGAATVARARPDGHTLGFVVDSFAVNPSVSKALPYDTLADLAPVTRIGSMPLVITVGATAPYDSLARLVEAARARPGAITYATVGVGSMNHLAAEMLSRAAGVSLTHVPYRGGGPAVTDLIGRHVDMMIMSLTLARAHLDSGAIRALAVTTAERAPGLDVPTVAETGVGAFTASAWQGVIAPAATPPAIIAAAHAALRDVMLQPAVSAGLGRLGIQVAASTPAEFGAFLREEIATWARVVREANIQPE